MKIFKKCAMFIMITTLLIGNFSFTSSAAEESGNEKAPIPLQMVNFQERKCETGYEYTCDLVQEIQTDSDDVSPKAIGWIKVGIASFRLTLLPDNGLGYVDWKIVLSNNDFIKGVSGELYVRKDLFGPFNPILAQKDVSVRYNYGTLYQIAQDNETFDFPGDISYDQAVIFEWKNFYVEGITDSYIIKDDNRQGKVSDFR